MSSPPPLARGQAPAGIQSWQICWYRHPPGVASSTVNLFFISNFFADFAPAGGEALSLARPRESTQRERRPTPVSAGADSLRSSPDRVRMQLGTGARLEISHRFASNRARSYLPVGLRYSARATGIGWVFTRQAWPSTGAKLRVSTVGCTLCTYIGAWNAPCISLTPHVVLPLPPGEGWGEGINLKFISDFFAGFAHAVSEPLFFARPKKRGEKKGRPEAWLLIT